MIKRQLETELTKTLRIFPALAILGPRQAGKTTLAKSITKKIKKKSIYLDMENPDDRYLLQNPLPYFNQHKNDCIIILHTIFVERYYSRSFVYLDKKVTKTLSIDRNKILYFVFVFFFFLQLCTLISI